VAEVPIDTVLDTPRCVLRVVSEADIPFLWSATRFAGFNDGMRWDAPNQPEEFIEVTRLNLHSWKLGDQFSFTVVEKTSGAPIGRVGIRKDARENVWAVGYWVHPGHWGKGFAVEATRALIEFGFSQLGAAEITVAHATWNNQSKRVVEKLGFRFVRENPCGFIKRGRPVPEYEYVLSRTEHPYVKAPPRSNSSSSGRVASGAGRRRSTRR
jgi:ribosomal-protein-alanine N-acetyltransferase